MMLMLRRIVFLLLITTVLKAAHLVVAHQQCGDAPLSEMVEFAFDSDETGKTETLLKMPNRKDFGRMSSIFIGYYYTGTTEGIVSVKEAIENFSPKNCVAIKLTSLQLVTEYGNSVRFVRKLRQLLPNVKRRNLIIEVLAFGKHADASVTVMELADGNFEQLYKIPDLTPNDESEMREQIELLVRPLVQFHEVAIHSDIHRYNYVYVTDPEDGKKRQLKLIDFDHSVLLPEFLVGRAQRANAQMDTFWPYRYTYKYAPEYGISRPEKVKITTKTDFWSVAIIFYELYLLQPKFQLDQQSRYELMTKIAEMYRGYRWVPNERKAPDSLETKIPEPLDYSKTEWLSENADALGHIFELRAKWPRIFLVITNMMQLRGQWRMSAVGILDFLAGKCLPSAPAGSSLADLEQMPLFSHWETSPRKLSVKLLVKESGTKELVELRQKLAQGSEQVRNVLREMKQRIGSKKQQQICAN